MRHGDCLHKGLIYSQPSESTFPKFYSRHPVVYIILDYLYYNRQHNTF
jgi:hypothetical protein